jgi:ketosteroid isomerase-like protein
LFAGVAPVHAAWRGQDPAGDDLAVLSALNEHCVRSFRESDVAWYDTHLALDFVVISSDGSYKDRAAALAAFALPTFAETLQSFPVERVQVRQFGNLAVIHSSKVYALKDGRTGESRYTDIWRRRGGQWRCVAAHITAHTSPGSAPR